MVFNVGTGIVALMLLPIMFGIVKSVSNLFGLQDIPVVTLALFHTTFNVLGVLLMWPFSDRLAKYLGQRFTSLEEVEGRPKYLDKNVAASPALALNALGLELGHIGDIARRMSKAMLSQENVIGKTMKNDRDAISQLVMAIGDFISRLERSTMPKDISEELPKVLRTSQYYLMASELAMDVALHQESVGEISSGELLRKLSQFKSDVVQLLEATDVQTEEFSIADCDNRLVDLNASYDELKAQILETGAASGMDIASMSALLEQNSNTRRLITQMVKAAHYLSELFSIVEIEKEPDVALAVSAG